MSFSNPRGNLASPITRVFEWGGGENAKDNLTYWDREKEERVAVILPFEFIVLDELATVSGFDRKAGQRIWANEVRPEDLKIAPMKVQMKGEVLYEGIYQKGMGGRLYGYAQAIYIAYLLPDGNMALGKFLAAGSARGAWFDFKKGQVGKKGKRLEQIMVKLTGKGDLIDGQIPYYQPTFEITEYDKEMHDQAWELDQQLQTYLTERFKAERANAAEQVPIGNDDDYNIGHATQNYDGAPPPDDGAFDALLNDPSQGAIHQNINPNDLPPELR